MELWWEKLKRLREERGWSLSEAAQRFIAVSGHLPNQVDSVRSQLVRYERGDITNPEEPAKRAIAEMFNLPYGDFWSEPRPDSPVPAKLRPDEFDELVAALRMPRVGNGQLDAAEAEVERLCSEYATSPAPLLVAEVTNWMGEISGLADRVNPAGVERVQRLAGWLALLRACLLWDQGDQAGSQRARLAAEGFAEDLHDTVMAAWTWEIRSWIALTQGDMPQAIVAAGAGLDREEHAPVAAQLHAQQAKAWARLGERHKTEVSLESIRKVLDSNPAPLNVRNHFNVDPTKASFYMMDAYRVLGVNDQADSMAETVIRTSRHFDGSIISPMRLAEAQLTKAVILARSGEMDSALTLADEALTHQRQCAPSLLLVAHEVGHEVARINPKVAAEFSRHVADFESQIGQTSAHTSE